MRLLPSLYLQMLCNNTVEVVSEYKLEYERGRNSLFRVPYHVSIKDKRLDRFLGDLKYAYSFGHSLSILASAFSYNVDLACRSLEMLRIRNTSICTSFGGLGIGIMIDSAINNVIFPGLQIKLLKILALLGNGGKQASGQMYTVGDIMSLQRSPLCLLSPSSVRDRQFQQSMTHLRCPGSSHLDHVASLPYFLEKAEKVIDLHQTLEVNGICLWCYTAGHVLGAAMFMFDIAGVRVLYTGNFSWEEDSHLRAAELPQFSPNMLSSHNY
ncbi:hypothetical protein ACET3Z_000011 [Daucus carota]